MLCAHQQGITKCGLGLGTQGHWTLESQDVVPQRATQSYGGEVCRPSHLSSIITMENCIFHQGHMYACLCHAVPHFCPHMVISLVWDCCAIYFHTRVSSLCHSPFIAARCR